MTIKYFGDDKMTPKQAAAQIIADKVNAAFYPDSWENDFPGLTERELQAIIDQVEKYTDRIAKLLNVDCI